MYIMPLPHCMVSAIITTMIQDNGKFFTTWRDQAWSWHLCFEMWCHSQAKMSTPTLFPFKLAYYSTSFLASPPKQLPYMHCHMCMYSARSLKPHPSPIVRAWLVNVADASAAGDACMEKLTGSWGWWSSGNSHYGIKSWTAQLFSTANR